MSRQPSRFVCFYNVSFDRPVSPAHCGYRRPIEGEANMPHGWKEITIEYNGKIINGSYRTAGKVVVVRSVRGEKQAPLGLGGLTPLYLAKLLLRELAREGMA
jgi:hypothetical protein